MVVKKMFTSIIFAIALVVSAPRFNEVVAQQVSSKAATVNSSNVGGAIDHAVQTPQTPDMPLLSQTQSERLDLVLIGTVSGGSEGLALFVDRKSKDVVSLRVGESRSGWTLRSIEPEKVTVERGDESESIRLHQLAAGGGGVQRTLNSSNPAPNTVLPSFASNPSFLKNCASLAATASGARLVQADGATPSPLVPPSVVQAPPATNVPMSSLSPSGVRLAQADGATSTLMVPSSVTQAPPATTLPSLPFTEAPPATNAPRLPFTEAPPATVAPGLPFTQAPPAANSMGLPVGAGPTNVNRAPSGTNR